MARFSFVNSRYTTRHDARIDMTPLVGVMLVLVMVFMVAVPATMETGFQLPGCTFYRHRIEPVVIALAKDGSISVDGRKTAIADLDMNIQADFGGQVARNQRIEIRGDKDMTYQDFFAPLSRLEGLGFTNIGLQNQDEFYAE